jgi:hypothetical protein
MGWVFMKLNVRAILTGFAVDFIGTQVACFYAVAVLSVIYGVVMNSRGYSNPEFLEKSLIQSPIYDSVNFTVGTLMVFMGGWAAAGVASEAKALHAALGGVLVIVASLLLNLAYPSSDPLWFQLFCYGVEVPLAAFGGWARQRHDLQNSKDAKRGNPPISRPF